jgi:protein involved in polysaccharide export with SLBB domain
MGKTLVIIAFGQRRFWVEKGSLVGTFAQARRAFTHGPATRRRLSIAVATAFALTLSCGAQQPVSATPVSSHTPLVKSEYRIGTGDDLAITYPYNAELNHAGPVGPDGRITLPLIGSVSVAGETINEAADLINNDLRAAGIVANAYADVQVQRFGNNVYVGGQVGKPGMVALSAGMDPLQAVITAGGFLDTAKSGRVAVIHRTADNRAEITYIDLRHYLGGQHVHTIQLAPYDVVYVPRSKIAEVDEWVDNYINKTLPFSRSLNLNTGNNGTAVIP